MNSSHLFFLLLLLALKTGFAQTPRQEPEFSLTSSELEAHLRFIASDELQGRRTGEPGNNIAARYIATQFQAYGVKQMEGAKDYFQMIDLIKNVPAVKGRLTIGQESFVQGGNMIILGGDAIQLNAPAVFAEYGWIDKEAGIDHYQDLDVEGKIVFVLSGIPNVNNPTETFQSMSVKTKLAADRGAAALIEIYSLSFPWPYFKRYFNRPQLKLPENEAELLNAQPPLPYAWIEPGKTGLVPVLKSNKNPMASFESSGNASTVVRSQNVIGMIEGTDPKLKNEYILLSAHYDHVGVGKQGGGAFTPQDSIFNGARDNGMGTVALLAAAEAFAASPPRRSVLFLALTGEEIGLLGSRYFVKNPLIPLDKIVFNLNTDGGGYNDKSKISIIGFDRVGAGSEMAMAAKTFGLEVFPDPAPEQNLFDRSDNVSFAKEGIPAPTLSPGFTGFDDEIRKYYHQVTDNPDTVDYSYLLKYCQVYTLAARLIANRDERPVWKAGDKYEAAGKVLYGNGN